MPYAQYLETFLGLLALKWKGGLRNMKELREKSGE